MSRLFVEANGKTFKRKGTDGNGGIKITKRGEMESRRFFFLLLSFSTSVFVLFFWIFLVRRVTQLRLEREKSFFLFHVPAPSTFQPLSFNFVGVYRVFLPSFPPVDGFVHVSTDSVWFYWVLLGFTGFYKGCLPGLPGFFQVSVVIGS